MFRRKKDTIVLLMSVLINLTMAQFFSKPADHVDISDVQVACDKDHILVTIQMTSPFEGLIYPKGLPKNSTCMSQYATADNHLTYSMPLWACNTLSTDVEGGVEYYNTIVVQPHRRLVTNQGKGFHIRCKYQTKEKLLLNNVNVSDVQASSIEANMPIPEHVMKIYLSEHKTQYVAENVNIGDNLTMGIALAKQNIYGMKITNCFVRDGLNWNEQLLTNEEGCPVDPDVMGSFAYSEDKLEAKVHFQAHKFPYTPTVYYKCNIKLCLKHSGGCNDVPPLCTSDGRNLRRVRRQAADTEISEKANKTANGEVDSRDLSVAVYSGLHVDDSDNMKSGQEVLPTSQSSREDGFCMSTRDFAIGIAIAGLILMLAVLLLVALLIRRRRRRKDTTTTSGSSIYSGPYSNPAYSNN